MSKIPSPSGSTQTTATSLNRSFSNQPSFRYPRSPNLLPHNPFSPYFPPLQQPVLPPSYPQAYHSSYPYTLQQANDPNLAHEPSDFSLSLPPNPVHLNQQYSVLPSHTNTPILHQNPSLSYEQHPLPPLTGPPPHPYHHGLSSQPIPLYSSTDPNSVTTAAATATSHLSLSPPDVHSLTNRVSSMTTSSTKISTLPSGSTQTASPSHNQFYSSSIQPLSHFQKHLKKIKRNSQQTQSDYTRHACNVPCHTEQSLLRETHMHALSDSTRHIANVPCQMYIEQSLPEPTCMPALSACDSGQPYRLSYHKKHSFYEQFFPPDHPRRRYTSTCNSNIKTAYHSPAPPLPRLATTPHGNTASQPTLEHQHPLSPAMQQYVKYLKNVYKKIKTSVYDKDHCLLQVKAKHFINIALVHKDSPKYMKDSERDQMLMDRLHGLVDAIQKKKTNLHMCDVCKSQDGSMLACCVLVEGAPGVGKTTFAYELCKRWARGELLWEWAAIVLIKLRDHRTRTAQNMYDLLYHPRPEVHKAVVDELIDHDGECMLMILDGYDELTDSQKNSTSVIQQIMSGELLTQSTLMVTSRPLATRTLHDNFVQSIDQHIEVLGFTEKNINEYIKSACGDKPELVEDFKSYLISHPFSTALMFNPLQCAIVTDLYRSHWECGDKGFAPKTLTELYTGLVHIMLLRYLTQHLAYKDKVQKIEDLNDLPKEVSQQLKTVTELAVEGIKKRQYVFDQVNTNIPSEMLGFLQREEVMTPGIGISASHNFLHLTLQEYLAAVNYSQQYSSPQQLSQLLTRDDLFPLNNFLEHYGKKREPTSYSSATHWPVVLFVAGRTKLSGVPTNIFKTGLHDSDDDHGITTVDVSLMHLLYETQSPQLIQSTLVTSRKYLSVCGSSALDWFVIGYCIANSTSTWRVVKKNIGSPKYLDQLVMGLRLGPEESNREYKIGSLHTTGHWTGNWKILSILQPYAKLVTELKLVGCKQSELEKCNLNLASGEMSACYPLMEELTIDNVESSYFASLLSFITQHSNLHILSLKQCNLSSIATSSLIHFLQSPNNRPYKLTLDKCTISLPEGTQHTTICMKINVALRSLDISWSVLDQMMSCINPFTQSLTELILHVDNDTHTCTSGVETILQEIPFNCPLLETLKIDYEYRVSLPPSIPQFIGSQQNNLHTLSLWWCTLCSDITRSLIYSLQSPHCKLYKLALYNCTIPITDHIQLTIAIVSSTTITHLLFIDGYIDTPSLTALASGLKHNTTIR